MSGGILAAPGWCGLYKEIWKERRLGFGQAIARRVKGVGNSFVRLESMVLDRIRSLRCLFLIWSFFCAYFSFRLCICPPLFFHGVSEKGNTACAYTFRYRRKLKKKKYGHGVKKVEVQDIDATGVYF